MSRPLITIAGETREMNDFEFAQYEKDQAEASARAQAEAEAKAQKQAILDRLGLTEEELRIVLG